MTLHDYIELYPNKLNGLFHSYKMENSTFHFRSIQGYFSFFFQLLKEKSKTANIADPAQTPHVWTAHCVKKDARDFSICFFFLLLKRALFCLPSYLHFNQSRGHLVQYR